MAAAFAILFTASAMALTGCSASVGNVRCDFTSVQNPHESHGSPGWMEGKATLKCTGAIDSASATIKMQKLSGGSWVDVSGTSYTRNIAPVKANTSYTIMTADKRCANGTYRIAVKGKGTLKGYPAQSFDWQYGNSAVIKCK